MQEEKNVLVKFLIQSYILIKDFKKFTVEFQAREIRKKQKATSPFTSTILH